MLIGEYNLKINDVPVLNSEALQDVSKNNANDERLSKSQTSAVSLDIMDLAISISLFRLWIVATIRKQKVFQL